MPFAFNIRFYEELNDFLAEGRKKKAFRHSCFGTPTIKDIIESLGVPHTEVDLILANNTPVDFRYKPQQDDWVSVYPVFESLDISPINLLRSEPLREPRFIADVHLGRLARYLRLMGFDTLYRNDLQDQEIVDTSIREKRIILTRDLQLLMNGKVSHGYYVRSIKPSLQVREVLQRFDLAGRVIPFNRCMECNGMIEKVSKDEIKHLLKPRTREFFDEFFRCSQCSKIYWRGTHYEHMLGWIEATVRSLDTPEP